MNELDFIFRIFRSLGFLEAHLSLLAFDFSGFNFLTAENWAACAQQTFGRSQNENKQTLTLYDYIFSLPHLVTFMLHNHIYIYIYSCYPFRLMTLGELGLLSLLEVFLLQLVQPSMWPSFDSRASAFSQRATATWEGHV